MFNAMQHKHKIWYDKIMYIKETKRTKKHVRGDVFQRVNNTVCTTDAICSVLRLVVWHLSGSSSAWPAEHRNIISDPADTERKRHDNNRPPRTRRVVGMSSPPGSPYTTIGIPYLIGYHTHTHYIHADCGKDGSSDSFFVYGHEETSWYVDEETHGSLKNKNKKVCMHLT